MASTSNLPVYINYYSSVGRQSSIYIEDNWLYKAGASYNSFSIFEVGVYGATASGGLVDNTYGISNYLPNGTPKKGNYIYTLASTGGTYGYLNVIDVSNKAAPTRYTSKQQSSYMYAPGVAYATSDYIYVGSNGASNKYLSIWSLATANNPTYVGQIGYSTNPIRYVYVHNNILYVAVGTYTLYAYSLDNPASPSLISTTTVSVANNIIRIYGKNNHLYVSGGSTAGYLVIVDVSNPSSPSVISTFISNTTPFGSTQIGCMHVSDNEKLLFFGDIYGGKIGIIDISNKTSPTYYNSFAATIGSMVHYNGLLYTGDNLPSGQGTITAYNVADHKFAGTAEDGFTLYAYKVADGNLFDSWTLTAGNYTAWPIFPSTPLHLLAVRNFYLTAVSYGAVTPIVET